MKGNVLHDVAHGVMLWRILLVGAAPYKGLIRALGELLL